MFRRPVIILISALCGLTVSAQGEKMRLPLDIEPVLAGNFGELRPNHFHSGVDFKTQGRTGLPVRSTADGYVSRVLVSPWGFGRAVYVVHPASGLTTVYGHLESFSEKIDRVVRNEQYSRQTFAIDLEFEPDEIPVKCGEIIAKSGNAGSSGGPHLHFDVRDTRTGDALDPLDYLTGRFKDTTPPQMRRLALYPVENEGTVTGRNVIDAKEKARVFTAWGKIWPAINAFDRMDGTSNIYGIKFLTLNVDGKKVYSRTIDRFSFDETRAVNTLAYYPLVDASGKWMMQTYVPPTNPLGGMIVAENSGIIVIDKEKDYRFEFVLTDHFGNTAKVPFTVKGKKTAITSGKPDAFLLDCFGDHSYNVDGVKVSIPSGTLYDDIKFKVDREKSARYSSDIYAIGNSGTPLRGSIHIEIPVLRDREKNKERYTLCRLTSKGTPVAVEGKYGNGKMSADVSRFGKYTVAVDSVAPKIVPLTPARWGSGLVRVRVSDNLSGIESYRGEIDGKFALFELDGKTATASFRMDPARFSKGKNHTFRFTAEDAAGNKSEYKTTFRW